MSEHTISILRSLGALPGRWGPRLQLDIEVVSSPRECVEADLVVTSGPILKNPNPVIEAGWLRPGAFASAVDFDSYWQGGAVAEADKLATDDTEQMEYLPTRGIFQTDP